LLLSLCLLSIQTASKELHFVTVEHAPHSFEKDEKIVGSVTQLLREIFETMGHQLKISSVPAKRALLMVESGHVDGIYPYTYNEARSNAAYFSNPISVIDTVFFKRKSSDISWETLFDLHPYHIGSNAGYHYPSTFITAERERLLTITPLFSQNPTLDNLKKLKSERIDLFICNRLVCQFYLDQYAPMFQSIDYIPKEVGANKTFHVGFTRKRAGASELRDQFNVALDDAITSGLLEEAYMQYGVKEEVNRLGSQGAKDRVIQ
ncbi:hypothetical protein A3765_16670, partial [Oleiphilus sp. HI0130]